MRACLLPRARSSLRAQLGLRLRLSLRLRLFLGQRPAVLPVIGGGVRTPPLAVAVGAHAALAAHVKLLAAGGGALLAMADEGEQLGGLRVGRRHAAEGRRARPTRERRRRRAAVAAAAVAAAARVGAVTVRGLPRERAEPEVVCELVVLERGRLQVDEHLRCVAALDGELQRGRGHVDLGEARRHQARLPAVLARARAAGGQLRAAHDHGGARRDGVALVRVVAQVVHQHARGAVVARVDAAAPLCRLAGRGRLVVHAAAGHQEARRGVRGRRVVHLGRL
mmetsp:Transcript_37105/g.94114  ORF Transcript_37105/g.94114 Transcript_37105/m.94114 type:complete len:280 (+) Transcript_37105:1092-1931(+)